VRDGEYLLGMVERWSAWPNINDCAILAHHLCNRELRGRDGFRVAGVVACVRFCIGHSH
jgi:hypothetical protein